MNEHDAMAALELARQTLIAKVNEYVDEAQDAWDDQVDYTPDAVEDDFILYLQTTRG